MNPPGTSIFPPARPRKEPAKKGDGYVTILMILALICLFGGCS